MYIYAISFKDEAVMFICAELQKAIETCMVNWGLDPDSIATYSDPKMETVWKANLRGLSGPRYELTIRKMRVIE